MAIDILIRLSEKYNLSTDSRILQTVFSFLLEYYYYDT